MTSGPVVLQVLEGKNAVLANREVMGATNPADAADGTIEGVCGSIKPILCMVRTARKMQLLKFLTSLLDVKSPNRLS